MGAFYPRRQEGAARNWDGLGGRVSGELVLPGVCGNWDAKNTLLEILAGLPFSKVEINCAREYIPSIIRLVEACSKTIVKLSLGVIFNGEYHPSSSSS